MKRTWICNCLGLGLLVPVGLLASRESLLRLIRSEGGKSALYKTLSQIFQDCNHSVTAIFRKMAAEEYWHVAVLSWCYRKRFSSDPPVVQPEKFDAKTLEQALQSGICRLVREKLAENRRARRFSPRWATGLASAFTRWVGRGVQWRPGSGDLFP